MKTQTSILILLFFFILTSISPATRLENIPLDSRVYPLIDELYSQGLFPDLHNQIKPYRRGDIASFLLNLDEKDLNRAQIWLVEKLKEEFRWEIQALTSKEQKNHVNFGVEPSLLYQDQKWNDSTYTQGRFKLLGGVEVNEKIAFCTRIKIQNEGKSDPGLLAKKWERDLYGATDIAYLQTDFKYLYLLWGRDKLKWGPGTDDNLLLSGRSPSFDMIKLESDLGRFKFIFFATILDKIAGAKRYLSGHRVNFKLKWGLELGVSEVIVYGGQNRNLEWYYLNPFLPFYGEQYNQDIDDNPLWSLDFSLTRLKDIEFYGELLIDDFQYDFKTEPHQIGFQLGMKLSNILKTQRSHLNLEYTRINNWVYGQNKIWNLYTYNGVCLGSRLGPDADALVVKFTHHLNKDFDFTFRWEGRRKGEGKIRQQPSPVPKGEKFPSGRVEKRNNLYMESAYQPNLRLRWAVGLGYERIDNYENKGGDRIKNGYIKAELSYRFWKELGF